MENKDSIESEEKALQNSEKSSAEAAPEKEQDATASESKVSTRPQLKQIQEDASVPAPGFPKPPTAKVASLFLPTKTSVVVLPSLVETTMPPVL